MNSVQMTKRMISVSISLCTQRRQAELGGGTPVWGPEPVSTWGWQVELGEGDPSPGLEITIF